MEHHDDVSRRTLLKGGGALLAGATVAQVAGPASAFAGEAADVEDMIVDGGALAARSPIPPGEGLLWLDQPAPLPPGVENVIGNQLKWEQLASYFTPADNFFWVTHYDLPHLDPDLYRLTIDGLVDRPQNFTLGDLKRRARRDVDFTLECSGNTGLPFFIGGVGNARWTGTPLASLLRRSRPQDTATEVVFWGADSGTVTIRDNSGITGDGESGSGVPDGGGSFDLTITEQFARSMKLEDAMNSDNLLCFKMNGVDLPPEHGYPVRLIAPGWYGVANVKWLTRIEFTDQRFAGRFMARDYVTIRETPVPGGKFHWTFMTVGPDRLKSAPAKVVPSAGGYTIVGVAWGAPIAAVKVRIDNGPWRPAKLIGPHDRSRRKPGFAWRFWALPWPSPSSGEHGITSRAIDVDGNVQPEPDDPLLAGKQTYWESNGQITRRVKIP